MNWQSRRVPSYKYGNVTKDTSLWRNRRKPRADFFPGMSSKIERNIYIEFEHQFTERMKIVIMVVSNEEKDHPGIF